MTTMERATAPKRGTPHLHDGQDESGTLTHKPFVSLIVPAFNEASIVVQNLKTLYEYMKSLADQYRWEIIVVNDGSTDETGELVESFAQTKENIRVLHHSSNLGLGQALKYAFDESMADYIVTLDMDLSYSPDHILMLLDKIKETKAEVVVASPYMQGGRVSNVPWLRRVLSVFANRFLSMTANGRLATLTSMVRVYDKNFLRSLNLKSSGMEINPEIIYKATLLHARIEEIPAHLKWHLQQSERVKSRSSMRVLRHTMAVLLSGFLFRPVMFFILPGFALLLFALYVNAWTVIHFFVEYQKVPQYTWFFSRASVAVAAAYNHYPHTFIVGGLALMLAIQIISLGILALQTKSYFEENFGLNTAIYRVTQRKEPPENG